MQDAYIIRKDGKIFDVRIHPYIIPDDLLLSLENGEWFFDHTLNNSTKKYYIEFIAWFIRYQLNIQSDYEDYIKNDFDNEFYGITEEFLNLHISDLIEACIKVENNLSILELFERETNQEFLRVRYGGKFETNLGVREIYFRVSSTHFNWYNIIWKFVVNNKDDIDYVSIVKDEVSLGVGTAYKGNLGEYLHMPIDDFITESGNPVIEWKKHNISVVRHLEMGGSITGILELPINNEQAWKTYLKLEEYEKKNPQFYVPFRNIMSDILEGNSVREVVSKYTLSD